MGRSNSVVFPWYAENLTQRRYDRVCVLGARGGDSFTSTIDAGHIEYHDITTDGWTIDDTWYNLTPGYDLVVCTRCAYFSMRPDVFIDRCRQMTKGDGTVFVDWGLGDHWRCSPYIVGWRDESRRIHESVTYKIMRGSEFVLHTSKLWSCYWVPDLETMSNVQTFRENLRRFGYDDDRSLTEIVVHEVPHVLDESIHVPRSVHTLTLWPDAPQLYVLTQYAGAL